jgi:hypothetical protein
MTEEQREKFRKARKAIDKAWDATEEIFDPLMAVRPERHGLEWDEAYQDAEKALGRLVELLEAQENLEILESLPERE